MELKHKTMIIIINRKDSSNRTFMELKLKDKVYSRGYKLF